MENIYLVGMMGSGKTSTGRALAQKLSFHFVDLDELICEQARLTINEIFKRHGEPYFRDCERRLLCEVSNRRKQVVATGGGVVLHPENRALMKKNGTVIYLDSKLETLWERVKDKKDRPLLAHPNPKKMLQELFQTRKPLYEEVASDVVITDHKSPEQVAIEISEKLLKSK